MSVTPDPVAATPAPQSQPPSPPVPTPAPQPSRDPAATLADANRAVDARLREIARFAFRRLFFLHGGLPRG